MRICVLGGSGFVGHALAERLVEAGHRVRIFTRRRERHRDLLVLPTAELVEGDVHNPAFLRQQFEGADAVINLVGILNERGRSGKGFEHAHAQLPQKVIEACRAAGVHRLLHMSALNASVSGPSHYLRTKGLGEEAVHRAHGPELAVTSFRPSVIFGPRDGFTNRFAGLLRLVPGVFPLACPQARLQPVCIDDVATAFVRALSDHRSYGNRYNLCGPKVYTLRAIVEYLATVLGRRVRVIGLNDTLSYLQALALEFAPGKPFSLDNYKSLQVDSVCPQGFPAVFGVTPASLEEVVPRYLQPRARSVFYSALRAGTRRS
jgi:NADH dehydrogenase